ncbi:UNVERIFIED_CONTAM: hypothetical protein RMT77_001728 [Armadillidium vulgare]
MSLFEEETKNVSLITNDNSSSGGGGSSSSSSSSSNNNNNDNNNNNNDNIYIKNEKNKNENYKNDYYDIITDDNSKNKINGAQLVEDVVAPVINCDILSSTNINSINENAILYEAAMAEKEAHINYTRNEGNISSNITTHDASSVNNGSDESSSRNMSSSANLEDDECKLDLNKEFVSMPLLNPDEVKLFEGIKNVDDLIRIPKADLLLLPPPPPPPTAIDDARQIDASSSSSSSNAYIITYPSGYGNRESEDNSSVLMSTIQKEIELSPIGVSKYDKLKVLIKQIYDCIIRKATYSKILFSNSFVHFKFRKYFKPKDEKWIQYNNLNVFKQDPDLLDFLIELAFYKFEKAPRDRKGKSKQRVGKNSLWFKLTMQTLEHAIRYDHQNKKLIFDISFLRDENNNNNNNNNSLTIDYLETDGFFKLFFKSVENNNNNNNNNNTNVSKFETLGVMYLNFLYQRKINQGNEKLHKHLTAEIFSIYETFFS